MKTQKILISALLGASVLTGCQSSYRATLDQKLENKSLEEKHIILVQECENEVKKKLKTDNDASVQHSERMLKICKEMTGQKVPPKKLGK